MSVSAVSPSLLSKMTSLSRLVPTSLPLRLCVCVCPSVCLFSWRATQEKCASLLAIAANGTYARPAGRTEDRRQRDRRMRRQREINWRVCDRSSGPITKRDTSAPPPLLLLLLLLLLAKTQWPCGHPRPAWYLCPGQRSDETTKLGLKLCRSQTHLAGWSKGPCPAPNLAPNARKLVYFYRCVTKLHITTSVRRKCRQTRTTLAYRAVYREGCCICIKTCRVNEIADAVATRKDKFIKRYSSSSSVVSEICSLVVK